MGHGDISRTYFTPSMQATLYEIRHHLTGKNHWKRRIPRDWYRPVPLCIPSSLHGYQRHVQVLHIFANCMMRPASTREIDILAYYTEDQPRNALFHAILHQITDKRFDDAIDLLLDETMFPNDHLPTTENYDSHYLWQRDMSSSDWRPRSSAQQLITLPAIDWLFAAKITLGGLIWEI